MEELRCAIVNHLLDKGHYDPEVDDYLIDIMIDNLEFSEMAKVDLRHRGLIIEGPNGNGKVTEKINPALAIYQMCQRNIHQAAMRLGVNRSDRLKLRIAEEVKDDEFDRLMNE